MITADDINGAFDALEDSFNKLAKLEDRQTELMADLAEYAEGSRKKEQCQKKIRDLQPTLVAAQRAFRLAGLRADRVRLLLHVEKTSMGRD